MSLISPVSIFLFLSGHLDLTAPDQDEIFTDDFQNKGFCGRRSETKIVSPP